MPKFFFNFRNTGNRRGLLLLACILVALALTWQLSCYRFTYNGVTYRVTNQMNGTAEVGDNCEACGNVAIDPYVLDDAGRRYAVVEIGSGAFSDCNNLRGIFIPSSVTAIGNDAFFYCRNLATLTIPRSVSSIGKYAFYDCPLENIYCGIKEPIEIASNVFTCYEKCTLHVPRGCAERYREAEGWKNFHKIMDDYNSF